MNNKKPSNKSKTFTSKSQRSASMPNQGYKTLAVQKPSSHPISKGK